MTRPQIRRAARIALASLGAAGIMSAAAGAADLKAPADFATVTDQTARGKAMFAEIGRVLQHPRCMNCHPAGDRPTQGETMHPHEPPVLRGDANIGVPGMRCTTCHQAGNVDHAEVPGHPKWHLAPIEMAWQGKSLGDICRQIKDPARNGGMTLAALEKHMAEDDLVGWGWNPGKGREPAPGTQKSFGLLFSAWLADGGHCPD